MSQAVGFEDQQPIFRSAKRERKIAPVRRTSRACDRCRFKKSKCNGQQPCKNCNLNDRTCIYSVRRRRDARNWYCGMQETVDEAMQRLYRACKNANSFPGILPKERDGKVTTENILIGLGLSTAPPPNGKLGLHAVQTNHPANSPESTISTTPANEPSPQTEFQEHHSSASSNSSNLDESRRVYGMTPHYDTTLYSSSQTPVDICGQFHKAVDYTHAHTPPFTSSTPVSSPTVHVPWFYHTPMFEPRPITGYEAPCCYPPANVAYGYDLNGMVYHPSYSISYGPEPQPSMSNHPPTSYRTGYAYSSSPLQPNGGFKVLGSHLT